jgi:hypothetical protein
MTKLCQKIQAFNDRRPTDYLGGGGPTAFDLLLGLVGTAAIIAYMVLS